jgi:tetratricopeptide (TPR) repeat protein
MTSDAPDLTALLYNGRRLGQEQRFDDALAVTEQLLDAIRKHGASAQLQSEAWGLKSVLLFRLGREEDALAAATQAVESDAHSALALVQRAATLRALGRYDEALSDVDAALAITPDVSAVLIERGRVLRGLNRLTEALASYEGALETDPHNYDAWVGVIRTLGDLGRYHDVFSAGERGAKGLSGQRQQRIAILVETSRILTEMERWQSVVDITKKILDDDTDNLPAWQDRGIAFMKLGQFDEALVAHRHALAQDPNNLLSLQHVGHTLYLQDHQEEALKAYDEVLRRSPDDTRTRELRAYTLARLIARGQLPDGYVTSNTPELDNPSYWYTEARALARLREYKQALAACDEGIRRYPAGVTLINLKATYLLFYFHRFREALQAFRHGIQVTRFQGNGGQQPFTSIPPDRN